MIQVKRRLVWIPLLLALLALAACGNDTNNSNVPATPTSLITAGCSAVTAKQPHTNSRGAAITSVIEHCTTGYVLVVYNQATKSLLKSKPFQYGPDKNLMATFVQDGCLVYVVEINTIGDPNASPSTWKAVTFSEENLCTPTVTVTVSTTATSSCAGQQIGDMGWPESCWISDNSLEADVSGRVSGKPQSYWVDPAEPVYLTSDQHRHLRITRTSGGAFEVSLCGDEALSTHVLVANNDYVQVHLSANSSTC